MCLRLPIKLQPLPLKLLVVIRFWASAVFGALLLLDLTPSLRWQDHKDTPTMLASLSLIRNSMPSALIMENVTGWNRKTPSETKSALEVCTEYLERLGYTCRAVQTDVNKFTTLVRKRMVLSHVPRQPLTSPPRAFQNSVKNIGKLQPAQAQRRFLSVWVGCSATGLFFFLLPPGQ